MLDDDQVAKQCDLINQFHAGTITQDEFVRRSAEVTFPDDEEARARYVGIYSGLLGSPIAKAIETAARLPGVDVPVGPEDVEAN